MINNCVFLNFKSFVMECIQKFFIHNFKFYKCSEFNEELFKKGISIYEVIRIENKVPLFLESHLNRLFHSADISNLNINEGYCDFETLIDELIKKNQVVNGKIKIIVHYKPEAKTEKDVFIYFTPHYFPSKQEIEHGVNLGLCKAIRKNPNAKILNTEARQKANHYIIENRLFEVLLQDSDGNLTEGSRSNIFFIKDNVIITPPENEVLKGITRTNILEICKKNNLKLIEKEIHIDDLTAIDSVFISGTSLKVLPVKTIEMFEYDVNNPILKKLIKLYDNLIRDYLQGKSIQAS